jgi:hypothetical protein
MTAKSAAKRQLCKNLVRGHVIENFSVLCLLWNIKKCRERGLYGVCAEVLNKYILISALKFKKILTYFWDLFSK